jgi:4-amino-4-deoxy-L-arabinose transferase-like glycosyltransferase
MPPDIRWASLMVLGFLAVTVWWLTQDTRVADWDSAQHTLYVFTVHDEIANGSLTAPFTEFNTYPPLGHLIGALGVFLGGRSIGAVILALNLAFVPLLAAGCYGTGRLVAGPRAGLLAVVFALGVPMIVSEAHEAYLDPLQAALVATSVWLVLASRRFDRVGLSALAGCSTGLAMLTKETTPIFLAGLLLVVLLRGGWRHWRGLLAYAAVLAAVAAPWYLYHRTELHTQLIGNTSQANTAAPNPMGGTYPSLLSAKNLSWYFWDAANIQLRAGLLAIFTIGTVAAIRRSIRARGRDNLYPEILGGAFVSWAALTWLTHKDPRYSLPALIYIAVLATAWIATLTRSLRRILTVALLCFVASSFVSVAFGVGGEGASLRVALPGAHDKTPLGVRDITFYYVSGWLRGPPDNNDGNIGALMRAVRRTGVRQVSYCCVNTADFNPLGLTVMTSEAGLFPIEPGALSPSGVFLALHAPMAGDPPACQRMRSGTGIYAELGNPIVKPFSSYTFICPGRKPEIYGNGASTPPSELRLR